MIMKRRNKYNQKEIGTGSSVWGARKRDRERDTNYKVSITVDKTTKGGRAEHPPTKGVHRVYGLF